MLVGDGPVATRRDRFAAVCEGGGVLYTLPPEIQQAGKVELTAVIHNHCAAFSFWEDRGDINRHPRRWPEESGGQATLEKIFDRCREMEQPGFKRAKVQIDEAFSASHPELANNLLFADAILHQLFEPERKRQWKEMAVAIDRVCELVSNRRHGPEPE